jgi:hypothetical protein
MAIPRVRIHGCQAREGLGTWLGTDLHPEACLAAHRQVLVSACQTPPSPPSSPWSATKYLVQMPCLVEPVVTPFSSLGTLTMDAA